VVNINVIFFVIGGLSLFLFGLNLMRESLIQISNTKLRKVLEKATGSKIKALITGILTTSVIQSSSGVTAIVVALISSDLLSFSQGIMIMIGANIGTTVTAFIFTLNIENYSLLIVFIGCLFYYFKDKKIKIIGDIITGFGILFFGIYIMNQGFDVISKSKSFINITIWMSNNSILGILGGTFLSGMIQSSSATIGIIQNLYSIGAISLKSAISIMLGANIGTTVASLIVSISASPAAKQAVYVNIIFNVIGGIIILIFITPFTNFFSYLESIKNIIPNKKITIAYSHLFYNIISTIFFYFIADYVIKLTYKKKQLTPMY